jgi:hypothetical protein
MLEVAPAVACLALAAIFAAIRLDRQRVLRLLSVGSAVAGQVMETRLSRGNLLIRFRFQAQEGERNGWFSVDQGRVVLDFGFWPEAGDTVFVVYDQAIGGMSTVWSVEPTEGRPRRGRMVQPLLGGVRAASVLGAALALALFAAVVWYFAK